MTLLHFKHVDHFAQFCFDSIVRLIELVKVQLATKRMILAFLIGPSAAEMMGACEFSKAMCGKSDRVTWLPVLWVVFATCCVYVPAIVSAFLRNSHITSPYQKGILA